MLISIEFPLRFVRIDDHKLGIFGIFQELFLTVVVLMSTFKNKNSLRTIEAEIITRLGQNLLVLIKKSV